MNEIQTKVAKAAADYRVTKRRSILEPHHDAVVLLRAKEASYDVIADLFQEIGVTVSTHGETLLSALLCRNQAPTGGDMTASGLKL